jgi:hypothetical protein
MESITGHNTYRPSVEQTASYFYCLLAKYFVFSVPQSPHLSNGHWQQQFLQRAIWKLPERRHFVQSWATAGTQ